VNRQERTARHEAGHAAAAVLLGLPILLVSVIPDAATRGRVRVGPIKGREMAIKAMIVGICGPLEDAESWDEVPTWGLLSHYGDDGAVLAEMAERLGLDRAGWDRVFTLALKFSLTDQYQQLVNEISGTLDYCPQFGPELIEQVHELLRRSDDEL
jgi:hypothetical protein